MRVMLLLGILSVVGCLEIGYVPTSESELLGSYYRIDMQDRDTILIGPDSLLVHIQRMDNGERKVDSTNWSFWDMGDGHQYLTINLYVDLLRNYQPFGNGGVVREVFKKKSGDISFWISSDHGIGYVKVQER